MPIKPLAMAADHGGYDLKSILKNAAEDAGWPVLDLGAYGPESVDYPDFAAALARCLADGKADIGVLVCGTGIGISIAANRFPHIRAALVNDPLSARLARQHNDANVLVLGAHIIGQEVALDCVNVFLETGFLGGRYEERREKMTALGGL